MLFIFFAHINFFPTICSIFFHDLFNFFARILYNIFAHTYTFVCLILAERDLMIFLMILFSPFFLLIMGFTITIGGNVRNVIEMCSSMFRIRCMTFRFLMTAINMFLHILVYGMYLFYLRFVHIQNLFCLIYVSFLCCARAF